ncbi:2-hydroxychromene-2-carboxylate isomerase [Burkholderiales bacterium JOSHI_001]|nr:2-hydroxychromene-2-carboxylate isomerase [Burkholderiales bacterium JOSHI_001]
MSRLVEYYFAPNSPWTYLGHQRLWDMARAAGARIEVLPVDLGGKVFPISGGLPLAKRAPQRQAYRLVELKRFSQWLGVPLNLQPDYFPVNPDDASRLTIAVQLHDGADAAMRLGGALLAAVWVQQRNIADEATLAALLAEQGFPEARLEQAHSQRVHDAFETYTARAIDAGVFGAPTYVVEGELFWGQDRLDFLKRRLAQP